MSEKILSITVPSYNAEKYLKKGIPTFLKKDILDDIEVLIINDGSKDNTREVAEEFQKNYPNSIRVVNKENGGHGSGVNAGIKYATGKYFCVIDADDWVDSKYFVKLIEILKNLDVDLVLAHAAKVDPDGKTFGYEKIEGIEFNKEIDAARYLHKINNIEMHNYYIKTDILKNHNVKCQEHCFYVDNEYILYSLLYVKSLYAVDFCVYQYLIGRNGQSVSMESRRKYYNHAIKVQNSLIEFLNSNELQITNSQKVFYEKRIAWFITGQYETLLSYKKNNQRKKEIIELDNNIRNASQDIYDANKNKCIMLLRISRFGLYGIASIVYRLLYKKNLPD